MNKYVYEPKKQTIIEKHPDGALTLSVKGYNRLKGMLEAWEIEGEPETQPELKCYFEWVAKVIKYNEDD